jgi:DNA polymerase III epsilon subunit-like protein
VIFPFFKNTRTKSPIILPEFWMNYAALFLKEEAVDSQSKFIVIDTETTGFDYEKTEYCALELFYWKKVKSQ